MKKVIPIIMALSIISTFVFSACKKQGSKNLFKVSYSNAEHAKLGVTCNGKEVENDDVLPEGSILTFTALLEDFYKVTTWKIEGGAVQDGGKENDTTTKVKLVGNMTVTIEAIFAAKPGYDATTGVGCVDNVAFEMKAIEAVKQGTIGNYGEKHNIERQVDLSPYRICTTEVTQELWKTIMKNNPSKQKTASKHEKKEKLPVESVSWYESVAFCNSLTERLYSSMSECVYYSDDALTQVYTLDDAHSKKFAKQNLTKKGFRLPTAAEWEWAAVAGTEDDWSGTSEEKELTNYAWYKKNAQRTTHQVKTKKPNKFGLYDMTGNVVEFVWDYYQEEMKESESAGKNPVGSEWALQKTAKGGSYTHDPKDAYRYSAMPSNPDSKYDFIGLRICCTQ